MKIYSIPSVLGGRDFYDETGRLVGHSVPSVLGNGEDFYGEHRGYSVDSVICGQDYYGNIHSVPSLICGDNFFGDENGYTIPSLLGGKDIFID